MQLEQAMCGGQKDFVFGIQEITGDVMVANTQPRLNELTSSHARANPNLIREVITAPNPGQVDSVAWYSDFHVFKDSMVESMYDLVGKVTQCTDTPGDRWPPFAKHGLPSTFFKRNASPCHNLRNKCTMSQGRLIRFMCPATCGCRSPRSGLYLNSDFDGCPREVCYASHEYSQKLASISCRDPNPEELRAMPGWHAYWQQYTAFWVERQKQDQHLHNLTSMMLNQGCTGLMSAAHLFDDFCAETLGVASVHDFCPVTCGCKVRRAKTCPPSCAVNGSSRRVFEL